VRLTFTFRSDILAVQSGMAAVARAAGVRLGACAVLGWFAGMLLLCEGARVLRGRLSGATWSGDLSGFPVGW
jgi:hypothetical protein